MSNRWLRFVIALVALAALGAAGYRIFQDEQRLTADTQALTASGDAADIAVETIGEIKAALHAYVAPGQGHAFWTARAGMLLDKLRGSLLELDRVAAAHGAPLTETLDLSDRLAAAEQRAREHVRNGQPLLAGDAIFTDARDLLDAIRVQVARARGQLAQTTNARLAATRRDQVMLGLGAAGIAALALLVLVPPARAHDAVALPTSATSSSAREPDEYARVIPAAKATTVTPQATAASSSPASATTAGAVRRTATPATTSSARPAGASGSATATSATKAVPAARAVDAPKPQLPNRWPEAAALCTDIARVSDSQEIGALLGRAAGLLNATGIVLWMAADERGLAPAATAGYDERVVSRIGSISRDDENLTAKAFRDAASKTSNARQGAAAALAVPLVTPVGPVGVFSAELRDVTDVDPQQLAIATIVSAQLSMLLANATLADPRPQTDVNDATTAAAAPPPQTAQSL